MKYAVFFIAALCLAGAMAEYQSEIIPDPPGLQRNHIINRQPYEYLNLKDLPEEFDWYVDLYSDSPCIVSQSNSF